MFDPRSGCATGPHAKAFLWWREIQGAQSPDARSQVSGARSRQKRRARDSTDNGPAHNQLAREGPLQRAVSRSNETEISHGRVSRQIAERISKWGRWLH